MVLFRTGDRLNWCLDPGPRAYFTQQLPANVVSKGISDDRQQIPPNVSQHFPVHVPDLEWQIKSPGPCLDPA